MTAPSIVTAFPLVGRTDELAFVGSAGARQQSAVSAANLFSGSDGPSWDDRAISVSSAALPPGSLEAEAKILTGTDELVWAYAALILR